MFVSDISRVGFFDLTNITTEYYNGLELVVVQIKEELMWNKTAYPINEDYYTEINGTANLSTSLGAPIIATKGHYF